MRRQGQFMSLFFNKVTVLIPSSRLVPAAFVLLIGITALLGKVVSADAETVIPSDAIRIRIIANSDSDFDQSVKRHVQAEVSSLIESWGPMPATRDEARELIRTRLEQVRDVAENALGAVEAGYSAQVTLADVPFPEKIFDGRSYAAGNYEALRITLGEGGGANWWCVLFPPLCLTAATAKEDSGSSAKKQTSAAEKTVKKSGTATTAKTSLAAADTKKAEAETLDSQADDKPKAKFFLWELLRQLIAFLKSLFS